MRVAALVCSCFLVACGGSTAADTDTDTDGTGSTTSGPETSSPSTEASMTDPGTDSSPDPGTDPSTTDPTSADSSSSGGGEPLTDPRVAGEEEVERIEVDFEAEDGTSIPLVIYAPTGQGPYPVVGLLHGFMLGPEDYGSYGEHIGSWGYVVVLPQMPGSALSPVDQVQERDWVREVLDWIDGPANLEGAVLDARADLELLAMSGHSRGGKIAFLTSVTDSRIDAIFAIDPVDTAGGPGARPSPDNPSVAPELMPSVVAPMTIVGETVNATGGIGGACAPAADNFEQYFGAATAPAAAIEFLTANHMSFIDDQNCGLTCTACPSGTDEPSVTRRMTQGYMVAFFEWQLRGRAGYRDYLAGPFTQPDVDAGLVSVETANGY